MYKIPLEYSFFWLVLFIPSVTAALYLVGRKLIDYYFEKKGS
jgi:hypothetical protein